MAFFGSLVVRVARHRTSSQLLGNNAENVNNRCSCKEGGS